MSDCAFDGYHYTGAENERPYGRCPRCSNYLAIPPRADGTIGDFVARGEGIGTGEGNVAWSAPRPNPDYIDYVFRFGEDGRMYVHGHEVVWAPPRSTPNEVEKWKEAFEDAHDEAEDFGERLNKAVAEVKQLRLHANSARALIERYRVSGNSDLLTTALQELDDAMEDKD